MHEQRRMDSVRRSSRGPNVPTSERLVSLALGSAALLFGLRRSSPLGWLIAAAGVPLLARGATGRCPVYRQLGARQGVAVSRTITVQRPRGEIYRVWRQLDHVPRFLEHVQQVVVEDERVSHWLLADGLQWMAETIEDVPDRRIAWRSIPGGDVEAEGLVELRAAPGGRGTQVRVSIRYQPPGGLLVRGPLAALLQRFTSSQLDHELRGMRRLIERGDLGDGPAREARSPALTPLREGP
jgi:uncharacterized membrane protein